MKVVTAQEMQRIESIAVAAGGVDQEQTFMEEAGRCLAREVERFLTDLDLPPSTTHIYLLCGKGHNGGDGYVCGRYLCEAGFVVTALQLTPIAEARNLCQLQHDRFKGRGGRVVYGDDCSQVDWLQPGIIVDALLGTGAKGPLPPAYQALIAKANRGSLPILAIDCPSGLDPSDGRVEGAQDPREAAAIRAHRTVFLELPKAGFFYGQAWDFVGELAPASFGLGQEFIDQAASSLSLVTPVEVLPFLPQVHPLRHKYEAGAVQVLAGSPGMAGAAVLCCRGALRSGCGIVFLSASLTLQTELQACPVEVVKQFYPPTPLPLKLAASTRATAFLVGPGLGQQREVGELLRRFFATLTRPCVLDADGLNHYAQTPFPLPRGSVMTPHLGELQRLLGASRSLGSVDRSLLERCQRYVDERQITLVIKGGVTFIVHPATSIKVIALGNPGMATAGSGDVLAGIIAGLLAQGVTSLQAAQLGVVLHGLAGHYARNEKTVYGLVASDLIDNLPRAFKHLLRLRIGAKASNV